MFTVPDHPKTLVSVTCEDANEPTLKLGGFMAEMPNPATSIGKVTEFPRPLADPEMVELYVPGTRLPLAEHVRELVPIPHDGRVRLVELLLPKRQEGPVGATDCVRVRLPPQALLLVTKIPVEFDEPAVTTRNGVFGERETMLGFIWNICQPLKYETAARSKTSILPSPLTSALGFQLGEPGEVL
jgi:hypothetical protein